MQDGMDDFFDGDSVDDVDLDELSQWFDGCISEDSGEVHPTAKSHRTKKESRRTKKESHRTFNAALDLGSTMTSCPPSP